VSEFTLAKNDKQSKIQARAEHVFDAVKRF
jgi:hypothetical protein